MVAKQDLLKIIFLFLKNVGFSPPKQVIVSGKKTNNENQENQH